MVDLESGLVVGMHVAGSPVSEGRKRGVGIAMTRFNDDLQRLISMDPDADRKLWVGDRNNQGNGLE